MKPLSTSPAINFLAEFLMIAPIMRIREEERQLERREHAQRQFMADMRKRANDRRGRE